MLKSTVLLAMLVSACAQGPSTSSNASPTTVCDQDAGCECDASAPPPPTAPCTVNGEVVDLDTLPANLDHGDGKVTFCHATSSATNPFVLITTSVNACFAHTTHEHLEKGGHLDIFPTSGCAD